MIKPERIYKYLIRKGFKISLENVEYDVMTHLDNRQETIIYDETKHPDNKTIALVNIITGRAKLTTTKTVEEIM